MSNKSIGKEIEESSNICSRFESVTFNSIREVLPDNVISDACVEVGHKYRVRRITPVLTVLHMIAAAIWPEDSLTSLVAVIMVVFCCGLSVASSEIAIAWYCCQCAQAAASGRLEQYRRVALSTVSEVF